MILGFVLLRSALLATGQVPAHSSTVTITVADEDGLPLSGAQIMLFEPGHSPVHLQTDYAENATNSTNPAVVNNVVDSLAFQAFSEFPGRALTARIRLISSK